MPTGRKGCIISFWQDRHTRRIQGITTHWSTRSCAQILYAVSFLRKLCWSGHRLKSPAILHKVQLYSHSLKPRNLYAGMSSAQAASKFSVNPQYSQVDNRSQSCRSKGPTTSVLSNGLHNEAAYNVWAHERVDQWVVIPCILLVWRSCQNDIIHPFLPVGIFPYEMLANLIPQR